MRIREFAIHRFGLLQSQQVQGLSDGITVILGDNEAGKSTCLNFFRAMLFGYSRSHKNTEFLTDKNGSGTLLLENEVHGLIRLFREHGKHGGIPVLTDPDGSPRKDVDLDRILRGCSVELYDRVFAFSLSELMHLGSLSDERIRHALHGAAFGTGLKSPGQVLRILDDEMKELFLPGGSKPKINVLLRELDAVAETVRKRGDEVAEYARLMTELEAASRELAASKAGRIALEEERRALERKAALRKRWEALRDAVDALAAAPVVFGTFTLDGRERVERLVERIDERTQRVHAARLAISRAEHDVRSLAHDAALARAAAKIFALAERKESVRNAEERITALGAERTALLQFVSGVCADIGPGWDAAALSAEDFSMAAFERCEALGKNVLAAQGALVLARTDHERMEQEKQAAVAALDETRRALHDLGGDSLSEDSEDQIAQAAERLRALLPKAEDAASETYARAVALREAEQAYDQTVAAIAAGWSRQDFEQVSLGPQEREGLLGIARLVADAQTQLVEEEREQRAAAEAHEQAALRVADIENSLARRLATFSLPGTTVSEALSFLDTRWSILRRAQVECKNLENANTVYASVNEQLGDVTNLVRVARPKSSFPWSPVVLFGAVLGLVCGGGLALLDPEGLRLGKQYALAFAASGGALFLSWLVLQARGGDASLDAMEKSRAGIEERLVSKREAAENARRTAEQSLASLVADAPEMFPGGSIDAAILADAEYTLARKREVCILAERETETLDRENAVLAGSARRLEAAALAVERCKETVANARQSWIEALVEYGLPHDTQAQDAQRLLERLETAAARRSAFHGRLAEMEAARERIGECFLAARSIPELADMLASLPEPDSHYAPDHGPWLSLAREYLVSWEHASRERNRLKDVLHMRESRFQEVVNRCARSESALQNALSAEQVAANAWKEWLDEKNLASSLSPETARRALDAAAKARDAVANARRLEMQIAGCREDRDSFLRDCAELAGLLPGSEPLAPSEMHVTHALALIDKLTEKARENNENAAVVKTREREIPALRDAVILAEEHCLAAQKELEEILGLAGCDSVEGFRVAHARWEEYEKALTAERTLRVSLEREAADAGLDLEELGKLFSGPEAVDVMGTLASLDERIGEAHTQEHFFAERKGALDAAMSGLLSDQGLTDLLAKRESLTGEIESLTREWTRLSLAKELLLAAKGRFESERQDGVAKDAGALFSAFTGGAYTGISVSLDGEGIFAVGKDGTHKNPETALSRGTREQLYLALRLAYIVSHGREAERLPVIMDDILVNFDAKRAANTAKVLSSFASEHQIIFFTCHERTAELLCRTSGDTRLFTLVDGVFSAS